MRVIAEREIPVRELITKFGDQMPAKHRLRAIVLGDPEGKWCSLLQESGLQTVCCPDRQLQPTVQHSDDIVLEIDHLLGMQFPFDIAIAVSGFQRIQQVHSQEQLRRLYAWLGQWVNLVIMEAPKLVLAPDLHDHGPYKLAELREHFEFATEVWSGDEHLASRDRPVLALSNQGLWCLNRWIWKSELTRMSNPWSTAVALDTYFFEETVLKFEHASAGDFQRCPVQNEIHFLSTASVETRSALRLPAILDTYSGRAASWLQRTLVSGIPLSHDECPRGEDTNLAVLDWAVKTSQAGIFHNDVRPWNLLLDGVTVHAIDFSDASHLDNDVQEIPQVVALCGTLLACNSAEIPQGPDFVPVLMDIMRQGGVLDRWCASEMRDGPWRGLQYTAESLSRVLRTLDWSSAGGAVKAMMDSIMGQER